MRTARPGWRAGLLVALGVWSSSWPLGPLFTSRPWWPALAGVSLAVVAAGALTRPRSRAAAPFVQLAALLVAMTVLFLPTTAFLGVVPLPASFAEARVLVDDAVSTIATSPAPAPGTRGVGFVITGVLALLVLLADTAATTLGRPLLATIPPLLPSLTTVAVTGSPATWVSFAGPVLALAALLYDDRLHADGHPHGHVDAPVRHRPALGAALAVLALAAASFAPALPHLPNPYPLGLGHGGGGRGANQVGFSPDPDLLSDLRDDDPTPVLRYRTDDPTPPPLRVSVATRYDGFRWTADTPSVTPVAAPELPFPTGLTVPRSERTLTVTKTRLKAPYLAAPAPLVGGTVAGTRWATDPRTGVVVVVDRDIADPTGSGAVPPDLGEDALDTSAATPALLDALGEATHGARTDLERAAAMEDWLRDESRFRYSLDLPDPDGADPVDAFLASRTGYCVQFATTMVLMARVQGIPARLATGFLSGTPEGTDRVVRADDAHAWPELYLAGYGWTRYEPTPATRTGATPMTGPRPTATATAEEEPTATTRPTTAPTTDRRLREEPTPAASAGPEAPRPSAPSRSLRVALPVVLALLLLAGAVLASPALESARHRRRLRAPPTPAARIDEHWRRLCARLDDLGLHAPPGATVRSRAGVYRAALQRRAGHAGHAGQPGEPAHPDRPVDEVLAALDRLVDAVEAGRYRPPSAAPSAEDEARAAEDAETIRAAVAREAPARTRRRARWWPSGGLASLRAPAPRTP